jgi:hypothetical protein
MASEEASEPCPECGEQLPPGARFCIHCETDLTGEGEEPVDLSELDGLLEPEDIEELLIDDGETRRANRVFRVLAGLAVSIPLAPLFFFIASSFLPSGGVLSVLLFVAAWLGPAALLSRTRLPAEAFGRSLFLIAAGSLLVPLTLYVRPLGSAVVGGANSGAFQAVTAVAFLTAIGATVLGYLVTRQARRRVKGEAKYFERHREE